MINTMAFTDFCHECPFNLPDSYINNIYNDYINNNINQKKLKEQCTNRRCIFNNEILESQYNYEYMCNYDPTDEFETTKNETNNNETINLIKCNKIQDNINDYNLENKHIYKFIEMCNSFDEFYICQRIDEPRYYSLKEDFKCPQKNYTTYLIIFCMISVILNLILSFFPWRSEYIKYKNILINLRTHNRASANSLNSTKNSSKNNKKDAEGSFKRDPTEIIIVYTNTEENMINDNERNSYYNNIVNNNKIKANDNFIKINTIIINNNIQINNRINNNYLINIDDMKKEDNNIKLLKLNKNQTKKKENEINNEIEKNIYNNNSNNNNYNNYNNNNRRPLPISERYILGMEQNN